ncbi:phage holin family protein [Anatilimnocola floriformis]|uniref:phage holin family protein n=1 Tax=Anatilimnocola floriformis TaxID=2948575 RepID=UPI0020C554FB|nr:phage holin family protein [Anatilimnocola floriformis]
MATDIYQPQTSEPSLTQLLSGIITDAQELLRQQLAMLRTEMKEDVRRTKQALVALVCGLALASVGVTLLCFMAVYGLQAAFALPLWACFGIVGGLLAAAGGGAFYAAVIQFNAFNPLPDESAQALKENLQWISHPK